MTLASWSMRRMWHVPAAALLLLSHAVLIWLFITNNTPTCDEPAHLCGGLNYLKNFDFTINPESGVFPQAWEALPNIGIRFPPVEVVASEAQHAIYREIIHPLLKAQDVESIYLKSRCMVALLSLACGAALFLVARRVAGRVPALLALSLYSFFPLFISNGALATADMAITLGFLISCAAFWLLFRRISASSLLAAAFAGAFLFLSKMSAPLILPVLASMIAMKTLMGSPVRLGLTSAAKRLLKSPLKKLAACAAALVAVGLMIWLAMWAAYGFRYSMNPPGVEADHFPVEWYMDTGIVSGCVNFARANRLLPEAYLYGFTHTYYFAKRRWSFLNGEMSMTGSRLFFPLAFLMKTPPPILISILIGIFAAAASLRTAQGRRRLFHLSPFLIFACIYLAVSLMSHLNIGYRHLMPAFPALLLLCALGFRPLLRSASTMARPIPLLLALWCAVEAISISPSQLAYFSPLFGGPSEAWRRLVDSSLDWGQDLKNLKGALERHGVRTDGGEPIFFGYFGSFPAADSGVKANILPFPMGGQYNKEAYWLTGGVYCISATLLQGINMPLVELDIPKRREAFEKCRDAYRKRLRLEREGDAEGLRKLVDSKEEFRDAYQFELLRFERLRRALVKAEPLFSAGHSILVFKLSDEDIEAIMSPDYTEGFRQSGPAAAE